MHSCLSCKHWNGKRRAWHDPGMAPGTCTYFRSITAPTLPFWADAQKPQQMTYEDDGAECQTFAARELADAPE